MSGLVADIMMDCEDVAVTLSCAAGRGRVLRAAQDVPQGHCILSAPVAHQVWIPDFACERPPDKSFDKASFNQRFSEVSDMCSKTGSMHDPGNYWAALLSLTKQEGPAHQPLPYITKDIQDRIMLLFSPAKLSSFCPGRQAADVGEELSKNLLPTVDSVVQQICKHFDLRVAPKKLEHLVLIWKYSSFEKSCDIGHMLRLYVAPAMMNHSCIPNCVRNYGDDERFQLFAAAPCGLAAGEEVTISYIENSKLDTLQRRELLALGWLFFCECNTCSCIKVPLCPRCADRDTPMIVLLSRVDEPLLTDLYAACSKCSQKDLLHELGYFFRCKSCALDLCPSCAAKTQTFTGDNIGFCLDGHWAHKHGFESGTEFIVGDTIVWSDGSSSKIWAVDHGKFSAHINGEICEAELVDGELLWSDGDLWTPTCGESRDVKRATAP